ncbi:MAG: PAS-domain containing protein [Deltaproteobacteria bacterium]|nr:PAS-domain containing protein [Deltaproteobacteria bacterium]
MQIAHSTKFIIAVVVFSSILAGFLGLADFILMSMEEKRRMEVQEKLLDSDVDLFASYVSEALMKYDYEAVVQSVVRWGTMREELVEIRVALENGFELANYQVSEMPVQVKRIIRKVSVPEVGQVEIHLTLDMTRTLEELSQVRMRIFLISLVFTLVLGLSLWLVLRWLAIRPLESEIVERQRAEEKFIRLNQDLEEKVNERTRDLMETRQRLSLALEAISEGFVLFDPQDRFVLCNSVYRKIFDKVAKYLRPGNTFEELVRGGAEEKLFFDPNTRTEEWIQYRLQAHERPEDVIEVQMAEGRWITIAEHRTQDGGFVSIVRDVTGLKKAESELRQAQKMEAIGQLTGGVAHDFNNILQIISGYAQLAQVKNKSEEQQNDALEKVLQAARRASDLTQQLLAFSRQHVHQPRNLDVNTLLTNLVKMLGRVIREDIEVRLELAQEKMVIHADPGMMEQVLLNICINARDAMPKSGRLTIGSAVQAIDTDFRQIHSWAEEGVYVVISISDTGNGMSPEVAQKIFDPFFTTKEVGKGTGLGLSTAYGIIQQHAGHIMVLSEVGVGSTFRIFLPASGDTADKVLAESEQKSQGGNETILVAEDEEGVLMLLVSLLESRGYKVLKAINGIEAINILSENPDDVDLVLMDVVMPKLSGREVYERMKKIKPDQKLVFSTGYAANVLDPEFIEKNQIQLIRKPYSPTDLFRKVREVLDG